MATTRNSTNMIATPGSPATVAPGGSNISGSGGGSVLDMSASGVTEGYVIGAISPIGTPPTVATTVKIDVSTDGTNFTNAVTASYLLVASTTTTFDYAPADSVQRVKVTVTNGDSTQSISTYVQGVTLTIS